MTAVDDAFDDFDHEFERLVAAPMSSAEQRRALNASLDWLYRLREHLKSELGAKAYYALADSSDDGRVTEGVIGLRGIQTHSLAQPLAPKHEPLYPGADTFPGNYTFAGSNLTWIDPDTVKGQLDMSKIKADSLDRYRKHAQGKMVLYTLDDARQFLRKHIAS